MRLQLLRSLLRSRYGLLYFTRRTTRRLLASFLCKGIYQLELATPYFACDTNLKPYGKPSSRLSEAGVLIHVWDSTESFAQRWRGCPPGEGGPDDGQDCVNFGDRLSASMIFKGHAALFGGGGGVIFRPEYTKILCSYGGDGGSRHGGTNHGCGAPEFMCKSERGLTDGWCDGAPHKPEDLANMLSWWLASNRGYNEGTSTKAWNDT